MLLEVLPLRFGLSEPISHALHFGSEPSLLCLHQHSRFSLHIAAACDICGTTKHNKV